MRAIRFIVIFTVICIYFSCVPFGYSDEAKVRIQNIKIEGVNRIDYQTIYSYAKIPIDNEVTRTDIDQIIKRLYLTKLFERVSVHIDKLSNLIITVKENPVIRNILIKGNKFFSDKGLKANVIRMKPLTIFTKEDVQNDIRSLLLFYRNYGKIGVNISHKVIELENNQVDVVFTIKKEYSAQIKNIKFIGNKEFSDDRLKRVLLSKEAAFYNLLSNNIKYMPDSMAINRDLLYRFYNTEGFIDFNIRSIVAQVSDDLLNVNLIFSIEEGVKYKFGKHNIIISDEIYDDNLKKSLEEVLISSALNEGFDSTKINHNISKIILYLNEHGNVFSEVASELQKRDNNIIDVNYIIKTGAKIHINNINIHGNTVTKEDIIRKNIVISDGDSYSTKLILRSQRKLANLGIFSSLNIEPQKINDDLIDLNVYVKEARTGHMNFAASINHFSELAASIDYKERNIFGTGNELSIALRKSFSSLLTDFEILKNKVFDYDTSLGLRVFYSSEIKSKITSIDKGFTIKLLNNITDDLTVVLNYTYKHNDLIIPSDQSQIYIKDDFEGDLISSFGYSLVYNKLDNYYNPKQGFFTKVTQELSGFGGSIHNIKTEIADVYYIPVLKKINDNIVLKFKSSIGYVVPYYKEEELKISQRFFIGPNEIRGFDIFGIGPRDKITSDALGGDFYFTSMAQLNFPLGLPEDLQIKGSLFVDTALLFDINDRKNNNYHNSKLLRISSGFGFSMSTIIGILRIDFGFPLQKEEYDVTNIIRFSMDTAGI